MLARDCRLLQLRDTVATLPDTSYFGIFYSPSQMDKFDISPTGPSIIEWFEKAKRVCKLFRVKEPSMVIPLRLTKGAYAVYQQLGDDADLEEIKCAFGTDPFIAWKQFVHLVMDYRELNKHVDAFTVDADVCTAKLREWCQQGVNVARLDLWRANLQVRVSGCIRQYWSRGRDIASYG